MIDRYSSITLDRPFAIADRDIEIGFPANANDEEVIAARGIVPSLDVLCNVHTPNGTNEMSVLFYCVRLRQVTSKIHAKFSSSRVDGATSPNQLLLASGHVYSDLDELLRELEEWRKSSPRFENPRCLYEDLEWYDILLSRERLLLIRKAVDLVPKHNGMPPKDLLELCLDSATKTTLLFADLFERKRITYTRSYFQMIFTAGLSILFCLSAGETTDRTVASEPLNALAACESLLQTMGALLPDARHYAILFEALRRHFARPLDHKISKLLLLMAPAVRGVPMVARSCLKHKS